MDCLMKAWGDNELFLKNWLQNKTGDTELAEDLLQDVFIKALKHKERFCSLEHARSWLLTMAKNASVDNHRKHHREVELLADPEQPELEDSPVLYELQQCMNRVLRELDEKDREAIQLCDIQGCSQKDYASLKGLSLVAGKSRVQRARKKLRSEMIGKCQIRFNEQGVSSFIPRQKN